MIISNTIQINRIIDNKKINNSYDPSDDFDSSVMKLWLDASETDYKTGNAQEYLTFNGSNVSLWEDRSGNDNHVSQATESLQPSTTSKDSQRVILFNDNELRKILFPISNNRSIFIVGKYSILESSSTLFGQGTNINNIFQFTTSTTRFRHYLRANGGAVLDSFTAQALTNTNYHIFNLSHNDLGEVNIYLDSISTASLSGLSQFVITQANIGIGGVGYAGGGELKGEISEVIILSEVVTLEQRTRIENYLSTKWGITI